MYMSLHIRVHACMQDGKSILQRAVMFRIEAVVPILLQQGAKVNAKDNVSDVEGVRAKMHINTYIQHTYIHIPVYTRTHD
jgi:hypothetical protein